MSIVTRETTELDKVHEVDGEIRELVGRDIPSLRRNSDSDIVANNISSLLQRVAGASVQEIDRLIAELQSLRETSEHRGRTRRARDRPVCDVEPIGHAVNQDHRGKHRPLEFRTLLRTLVIVRLVGVVAALAHGSDIL